MVSLSVDVHRIHKTDDAGQEKVYEEFVGTLGNAGQMDYPVPKNHVSQWTIEIYPEHSEEPKIDQLGPNIVLVGTGDNFAPNYFARAFDGSRDDNHPAPGKELYDWDPVLCRLTWYKDPSPATGAGLEEGIATIPTDNVACFLSYAKYDAIFDAKHGLSPLSLSQFKSGIAINN
ncbi:MAG: hypothetical protein ABSD76_20975 [Terriglobales bacterium]|jgi:hypothetical protein